MQPGSEAGPVLDPALGCGANPFSQREDAGKTLRGPPFLSRGKQAQGSQKPALSKFSEPPRKVHFWFPCLAFPDSWMILLWRQSSFQHAPHPARGEAPPTSRTSSRDPSFFCLQFSICPRGRPLPSCVPSVGQDGRSPRYKVEVCFFGSVQD